MQTKRIGALSYNNLLCKMIQVEQEKGKTQKLQILWFK